MKKRLFFSLFGVFAFSVCLAQKHIVVLGSSTAAGTGAAPDSGWVKKLEFYFNQNNDPGDPDTIVTNLAVGGYTSYHIMPTGSPPFAGISPQTGNNISYALSLNPDIIIINLPSNDTDWNFPKKNTMDNLRLFDQMISSAGKRAFITTTQPRNFADFARRDSLRTLADSIQINFGVYSIDFWSDLVSTDGLYNIRTEVSVGDGVHVNNLGHRLIFQRTVDADIFFSGAPLPLKLTQFSVQPQGGKVLVQWETAGEEASTSFEVQKSSDGRAFTTAQQVPGKGGEDITRYQWIDGHLATGRMFYRLLIREENRSSYSQVVSIKGTERPVLIDGIAISHQQLRISIAPGATGLAEVQVYSAAGSLLKKQAHWLNGSGETISLNVGALPAGSYLVNMTMQNGERASARFLRLK